MWQNVDVDMPILSTSGLCTSDGDLVGYHNKGGFVYNHETKDISKFVKEGNAYFMKAFVPKNMLKPKPDVPPPPAAVAARPEPKGAGAFPKPKGQGFAGQAGA